MAVNDTSDLIAQIKRRAFVPTNQATYSNDDFLGLLNDAMRTWLVPAMRKVRENYFIAKTDWAVTANQADYAIPSRAMGNALRLAQIITPGGQQFRKLPALELVDLQNIASSPTGTPQGFYWNGTVLTLYPAPTTTTDTLRLYWFNRPNTMVTTDKVGIVLSVNNQAVTLSATPPSGFTSGALYDIVQASPPYGTLTMDNPATIAGNVLTFTNALATSPWAVQVGDQVCLAQQAGVAQAPLELQPGLVQRAVVTMLEGIGDADMLGPATEELMKMEKDIPVHITPRSEGNPRKAANRVWL